MRAPAEDKRWKIVDARMRRLGYQPSALIENLHSVKEAFGYLEKGSLQYVALALHVPFSRVHGVATFYHFFTLKPKGEHVRVVCMGSACSQRHRQRRFPEGSQKTGGPLDMPFFSRQHKILLENCGRIDPERIEDYIGVGGYSALLKARRWWRELEV